MAGDLALHVARGGLVAERELADGEFIHRLAADVVRTARVVVAGQPNPLAADLQTLEHDAMAHHQARGGLVVVEGIAQGQHSCGCSARMRRARAPSVSCVS